MRFGRSGLYSELCKNIGSAKIFLFRLSFRNRSEGDETIVLYKKGGDEGVRS